MKTIKDWLSDLPEPYRTQALENTTSEKALESYPSLYQALLKAFTWNQTPQGERYWDEFHDSLGDINDEPPTNALSAIHAIALKKGFPAEDIISVSLYDEKESKWVYGLKNSCETHFINLSE